MRSRCTLPQSPYKRIWPRRWIAFVSTSPKRRDGWPAHHPADAVDAQDRIIDYLHQDEVADTELAYVAALPIESAPLPPIADDPSLQKSSVSFGPDRDCISIPQGD